MKKYNDKVKPSGDIELIQVSLDRDPNAALSWAKKEKFPWPSIPNSALQATGMNKFKVRAVPTYILVDKDGKEISRNLSAVYAKMESGGK